MFAASSHTRADKPGSGGGETKPPEERIRSFSPGESGFWSMERGMAVRFGVVDFCVLDVVASLFSFAGASFLLLLVLSFDAVVLLLASTALESPALLISEFVQ